MKKLLKNLADIPQDKLLHFIAGMIVAAIAAIVSPNIAFVASILAGSVKEIYDDISYRGADLKDLVATIAGGLTMQIFVWIY